MTKHKSKGAGKAIPGPPRLYIVIEGGVVQSVSSEQPKMPNDLRVTLIDYDTDDVDPENLTSIRQDDGRMEPACVSDLTIGRTTITTLPWSVVKSIVIRKYAPPQKLVFAAADSSYAVVVTAHDLIEAGTPIQPESGDDLEFWGIAEDDVPCGPISPEIIPTIRR